MAYAGHQYGFFTMLGDGRAHVLGEIIGSDKLKYDIQLKGSGRTLYSRGGDGKATLSAMLREYLISEAFAGLNIPTTRSLALIASEDIVYREKTHYQGVLTRIASSHIRVGTFEFSAHYGGIDALKQLADYTMKRHYPSAQSYYEMFNKIIEKQAKLIAKWQSIGFVHGVMNTDNMSICGETIDYGPCAFLDKYQPNRSFSSIDYYKRYSFENQPTIAKWNLSILGECLKALFDENKFNQTLLLEKALDQFDVIYNKEWLSLMANKLGLSNMDEKDHLLIHQLLNIMEDEQLDYTNTFIYLTYYNKIKNDNFTKQWTSNENFNKWFKLWLKRIVVVNKEESNKIMIASNPKVIARNHLVEQIISDFETKQSSELLQPLLTALNNPFTYDDEKYLSLFQENIPDDMDDYVTYCGT